MGGEAHPTPLIFCSFDLRTVICKAPKFQFCDVNPALATQDYIGTIDRVNMFFLMEFYFGFLLGFHAHPTTLNLVF